MPNLNTEEIKKLKKGELVGLIAIIGCAVVCVAFVCTFTVASVKGLAELKLAFLIWSPIAVAILAGVAAFFNLKYGKALDRLTKDYIQSVFVENAALMRPERDSLTYYVSGEGTSFIVKVNNFKEEIVFDFSAFGKLSAVKRAGIYSAIVDRLGSTFCRLYERGGKYKSVTYTVKKGEKQGKLIPIIENGAPDKRIYKNYRKSK